MTHIENLLLTPVVIVSDTDHKILFRQRKVEDQKDIYWLNNRSDAPASATISFNITGKLPKLWNAQTGIVKPVGYEIKDGRTLVPLHLESWDAIFVVFEENTAVNSLTFSKPEKISEQLISGSRQMNFNGKTKEVSELKSWTEAEDTKYYSGTAAYSNEFELKKLDKKVAYFLELSDVKNVAEVYLNGQEIGTIWKNPYRIDLTKAIKKGKNTIEIKVNNLWVNRLIGDVQPDVQEKTTFTTMPFYGADAPLLPSGLLGPVKLMAQTNE